jgi:hypothetical protein
LHFISDHHLAFVCYYCIGARSYRVWSSGWDFRQKSIAEFSPRLLFSGPVVQKKLWFMYSGTLRYIHSFLEELQAPLGKFGPGIAEAQNATVHLYGFLAVGPEKFQRTFGEVARQHKTPLVPFMLDGFAEQRSSFLPDGIHPAAEAQPLILDTVWKELRPLLK